MPNQICTILLLIFLQFFFSFSVLAANNPSLADNNRGELRLSDCDKCHQKELSDLLEAGLAHKTELSCRDCHSGHRPKSFENIPHCALCHNDQPHYQLQQCLPCHQNPHRPREIRLPKKAHNECMTCHLSQGDQLARNPSYHSALVCTDCHQQHGQLPPCMSCHKGHNNQMTEEVCQNCHQPHQPLAISYAAATPTSDCSGCHSQALQQLNASPKKHRRLTCATCHPQRHKTITGCRTCHGEPHADAILDRFPDCGACHGKAHSLQ